MNLTGIMDGEAIPSLANETVCAKFEDLVLV
jgi:hypothetical protein